MSKEAPGYAPQGGLGYTPQGGVGYVPQGGTYSPQPPHSGPPPPVHQHAVLLTTSGMPMLGPMPMRTTCPHCQATITTNVRTEADMTTHLFALALCFFGCCCIPYCVDSCKSKKHFCPNCSAYLGAHSECSCL